MIYPKIAYLSKFLYYDYDNLAEQGHLDEQLANEQTATKENYGIHGAVLLVLDEPKDRPMRLDIEDLGLSYEVQSKYGCDKDGLEGLKRFASDYDDDIEYDEANGEFIGNLGDALRDEADAVFLKGPNTHSGKDEYLVLANFEKIKILSYVDEDGNYIDYENFVDPDLKNLYLTNGWRPVEVQSLDPRIIKGVITRPEEAEISGQLELPNIRNIVSETNRLLPYLPPVQKKLRKSLEEINKPPSEDYDYEIDKRNISVISWYQAASYGAQYLPAEEKELFSDTTYEDVNKYLRRNQVKDIKPLKGKADFLPGDVLDLESRFGNKFLYFAYRLRRTLEKLPPHVTTVYRGIPSLKNFGEVGQTYTDYGFMSCSTSIKTALQFASIGTGEKNEPNLEKCTFVIIFSKTGRKLANNNLGENEVLIPNNTSFKIVDKFINPSNGLFCYVLDEIQKPKIDYETPGQLSLPLAKVTPKSKIIPTEKTSSTSFVQPKTEIVPKEKFAKGGTIEKSTLSLVGESGEREYIFGPKGVQLVTSPTKLILGESGFDFVVPEHKLLSFVRPSDQKRFESNLFKRFAKRVNKFFTAVNLFLNSYRKNKIKAAANKTQILQTEKLTKRLISQEDKQFEFEYEKVEASSERKQVDLKDVAIELGAALGIAGGLAVAVGGGGGDEAPPPPPGSITGEIEPRSYPITQHYGVSNSRDVGGHPGVDIGTPTGTYIGIKAKSEIIATDSSLNNQSSGYGHFVVAWVPQANKQFLFGHLSQVNVSKGQQVPAGGIIGRTGATGRVTGEHLHFEIHNEKYYEGSKNNLNPEGYINWLMLGNKKNDSGYGKPDAAGGGKGGPKIDTPDYHVSSNKNVQFAIKYLMNSKLKLTAAEASGWIGNLLHESEGMDPKKLQHGGGGGLGIAQWSSVRFEAGRKWWNKKTNGRGESFDSSLEGQLGWLVEEASTPYYKGTKLSGRDAENYITATENFEKIMEGANPLYVQMEKRKEQARRVYEFIVSKQKAAQNKNQKDYENRLAAWKNRNWFQKLFDAHENIVPSPAKKVKLGEGFAKGGIVSTKQILVGEAGIEFLIPISRMSNFINTMTIEKYKSLKEIHNKNLILIQNYFEKSTENVKHNNIISFDNTITQPKNTLNKLNTVDLESHDIVRQSSKQYSFDIRKQESDETLYYIQDTIRGVIE